MENSKFAVIGAGINGAAVAREILIRFPQADVTIFDKAPHAASHQSGHNSGVVHAGLYYEPGSLKARLCRRGVELIKNFALENQVPYEECGKLVVALNQKEEERLTAIFERATANGVPDVELVGPERIKEIEPNAIGTLALYSPHTAIIDFAGVTRALIKDFEDRGGKVRFNSEIQQISNTSSTCSITTANGTESFDHVIACAGLQSDRIAQLAGGSKYPKIVPFFGQYSKLDTKYRSILNGLVYPVPDPAYPFLGVHLTKRVDGEMLIGPNAFLSFGRENYRGWKIGIIDSLDVATTPGFWKFASKNLGAAVQEFNAVVSRKKFLAGAAKYVPTLVGVNSTPITRGIRAQAMDENGNLVDDFVIEHVSRATLIRNAPSPGATSSLAIAEHIVDVVVKTHQIHAT